jgi:hypothetical protein
MNYRNPISIISILISVFAIFLLMLHLIIPSLTIDIITITLFLIAIIPWAGQIFKSIKLPGGFQIEYQELRELSQKLRDSNLIAEPTEEPPNYERTTIQSLSPTLQLANLRIEIEKRLRHLAELCGVVENRRSLNQVVISLFEVDALSLGDLEVLRQLFRILNPAIHGEEIADPVFFWAMEEGPGLLAGLDRRIERRIAGKPAL